MNSAHVKISAFVCTCVLLAGAGLLVLPDRGFGATKQPFYSSCNASKSRCYEAGFNASHRLLKYFYLRRTCTDGKDLSIPNVPRSIRVSRSGRFRFTKTVNTGEGEGLVIATATVRGRVYKRKRVTGSWSVDAVAPECAGVRTGKFSARFRFYSYGL